MKQWYTIFTKANLEPRVAATLNEREIETFLPQIRTYRTGVASFRNESLFPCYLFMHADLETLSPQDWQWTPGLRYMVHFAGEPAITPDIVIDIVRKETARLNESDTKQVQPFRQGEVVRIARGPLADLLAVFDGPIDNNSRSQVLIDFLGRICRAKVALNDLEKVTAQQAQQFAPLPRRTRGRGRPIVNNTNRGDPRTI